MLEGTDLVFTGEGRIDGQSLRGKVVVGVARAARKKGVPVIAVVGDIADGAEAAAQPVDADGDASPAQGAPAAVEGEGE